jgi:predicted kinase
MLTDFVKNRPLILVVTGLPCTGKTTLGKYLAGQISLPFIHKDGIKEKLFDSLGWEDRAWSRKLGAATYDLLYYVVETLMSAEVSMIVESNFQAELAGPVLGGLTEKYEYSCVQVLCKAEGRILVQRFRERAESGERHSGHVDATNYDEMEPQLRRGRIEQLQLTGPLIEIDTSDFDVLNWEEILQTVRQAITGSNESQKHP